ncbi:AhpC/TSA family protein [Maribellus sp. CM-23]|uniref:peroxiredoxin-like family protein n=1 Tax=Maribellus sp. CM-23 TaxID=2781026 RepID=UPI001F29CC92|nr:peroxiredoxin-like family protein [Maribellus sp. CM-23]MCE4563097.1 AhpC/TSA family protein [Maribellus sp. CM-23]
MKHLLFLFLLIGNYAIAQIPALPEQVSPLLIGEQIPEAELKSAGNTTHQLSEILAEKPSILLFYRGGWCPYCNAHLSEIQEAEREIIELGYQIVAISPDAPENLKITEDDKSIRYQLYSDADGQLIKAMGIAFKAPEQYSGMLSEKSGGLNKGILPVPSVFVVSPSGKIQFEYINPDYSTRLSGKLLLAILKNM